MQATLLGIPHVIIQFNVYEGLKNHFSKKYETKYPELPLYLIFNISIISKSNNRKNIYNMVNFFFSLRPLF